MSKMKYVRKRKPTVYSWYMKCRFCGYSGNFPDSGECPICGETN